LANVNIRTVPRRDILAAFVGHLYKDTSKQQLTDFLTAEGMKGVVCKKLQVKDGKKFSTAAFYVTCCAESVNVFMLKIIGRMGWKSVTESIKIRIMLFYVL